MNAISIETLKAQRNHALDIVAQLAGALGERDGQIANQTQEIEQLRARVAQLEATKTRRAKA